MTRMTKLALALALTTGVLSQVSDAAARDGLEGGDRKKVARQRAIVPQAKEVAKKDVVKDVVADDKPVEGKKKVARARAVIGGVVKGGDRGEDKPVVHGNAGNNQVAEERARYRKERDEARLRVEELTGEVTKLKATNTDLLGQVEDSAELQADMDVFTPVFANFTGDMKWCIERIADVIDHAKPGEGAKWLKAFADRFVNSEEEPNAFADLAPGALGFGVKNDTSGSKKDASKKDASKKDASKKDASKKDASAKNEHQDLIDAAVGLDATGFNAGNAQAEIDRVEELLGEYDGATGTVGDKEAYNAILDYIDALNALLPNDASK